MVTFGSISGSLRGHSGVTFGIILGALRGHFWGRPVHSPETRSLFFLFSFTFFRARKSERAQAGKK